VRESDLLAAKAALRPVPFRLTPRLLLSKNAVLLDLVKYLRRYNLLLPAFLTQRRANPLQPLDANGVELLDRISMLVLIHLAAKSPALRRFNGREKWNDVVDLTEQLKAHARYFNIKLLDGNFHHYGDDVEDLNFWLERLDPEHNAGNQGDTFYAWAKRSRPGSFKGGSDPTLRYLDEMQREAFRVHAEGGRVLYNDATVLDTKNGSASLSGRKGIYIYVCSALTRQIYTFDSQLHVMHHSSFLKGQAVLAAGTWLVEQGEVMEVDGESGHYKPTTANLRTFATVCSRFWSRRTVVRPAFDRADRVLMSNFILLGDAAPLLKATEPVKAPPPDYMVN